MKTATILLLVLAIGLVVTGCSKVAPTTNTNPANVPASTNPATDTANIADLTVDTNSTNPDIGTLDDTPVSDELPQ